MVLYCEESGLVLRGSEHVPDVIRQVLLERGWNEYDEDNHSNSEATWNLWWKTQRFRKCEHDEIAPWQRLNHFPKTDAITRKDNLARNLRRMRCVHGAQVFNFHPEAYILPNEYTKFVSDYAKENQKYGKKNLYWICKPVDLSRGRGIFVFRDLKHLTYDCSVVVQRYITNPFLISGYKFDLRIYVCVPSFQPLTIYMYQEGIVRFSTDKFDMNQLNNVFSHLTNTSINKYGPSYATDKERVGPGCKWTLSQFRSFLHQLEDVDEPLLWFQICYIITLTLATQSPSVPKCQNCFEVFGFDILVDDHLKPWLLEVNFSPALSMDCQADFVAKRAMVNDLIDLLNFKESDSEHGGKSFRDCCGSSVSRLASQSILQNANKFNSRSPSPTKKRQIWKKDKGDSSAIKVTVQRSTSKYSSAELKKDHVSFKKPETKSARKLCNNNSHGRMPQVYSSYKMRRMSCESTESLCSKSSSFDGLPRNLSSSSVASSSSSSIDLELNQLMKNDLQLSESKATKSKLIGVMCDDESLQQNDDQDDSSPLPTIEEGTMIVSRSSSKTHFKKKTLNSAPPLRKLSTTDKTSKHLGMKPASGKFKAKIYKSPYSIASTTIKKSHSTEPWPRTRVGDFVLTFPLTEAMRRATGFHFDMKTIIRENQKILKKLKESANKRTESRRKSSTTSTKTEALQLSFQLKFDDKEANPFYLWGPQNPPLLSSILH